MKALSPCLVCGNDSFTLVLDQKDSLYFQRRFLKCNNCGLVFVNPQPSIEELEKLYNDEESFQAGRISWDRSEKRFVLTGKTTHEQADVDSKTSIQIPTDRPLQKRRAKIRIQILKSVSPPPRRLLDIGCREGDFLEESLRAKYIPRGIEISSQYAQSTCQNLGINIFCGTLEQYVAQRESASETFDIVTLWDVIEHLIDPLSTMRQINSIQKEGDVLAMSTVNLMNYRYLQYGEKWRGFIEGQEHVVFFSSKTISTLFERAGYKSIKILTRSIAPVMLRWLNLFRLGNDLEIYARKTSDCSL